MSPSGSLYQMKYRLAWRNPLTGKTGAGEFVINDLQDAAETRLRVLQHFPMNEIWVEDKHGQRVQIPAVVHSYEEASC